ALHPGQGAVRPLHARRQAWRAALRQARLHHGRLGSAAAPMAALRAWRGRQRRSVAQRLARDLAEGSPDPGHPEAPDPPPAGPTEGPPARAVRPVRAQVGRRPEGRPNGLRRKPGRHLEVGDAGSTHGELSSLADYVGRMKEGQDAIYYMTAATQSA